MPVMDAKRDDGHVLALIACGLLVTDVLLILMTAGAVQYSTWFRGLSASFLLSSTPLPFALYTIWALGIFGAVAALAAIIFYNYHHHWFWRCLIVAAALFLLFPPIHTVIGIISLILLLRFRRTFSNESPLFAETHGT